MNNRFCINSTHCHLKKISTHPCCVSSLHGNMQTVSEQLDQTGLSTFQAFILAMPCLSGLRGHCS